MKRTLIYSIANIKMIFDNLVNLNNQGIPKDFEIKIDDMTTVHRTNDLSKFHCYQKSLTPNSNEVSFILFKGNSRRYDKYILVRKGNVSPDPNMTTQQYIESKVAEALKLHEQQMEFARLKEKTKSQKKTIETLKERIAELEAKNKGELHSLIQLAQGYFQKPNAEKVAQEVNGISNDELAKMIGHYRNQYGEEIFGKALGIGLQVAEHPHLIEEVKEFINEKIKDNESNKK